MEEKILTGLGLSPEQIKVYLFLIENGYAPVKVISAKTAIGRAFTYKILGQLGLLGLVQKRDDLGKITLFGALHPLKLRELAANKKKEADEVGKGFEPIYGKLVSMFNLLQGKPNVQFYEGLTGLQNVYSDILDVNQDIMIISSPVDDRTEALDIIREQINKQKEKNIRTKAITPIGSQKEYATPLGEDEKFLITRKSVPAEKLKIPAQIILYGDKVAITNFRETIITVVIESKYIHETFKIMFDYIWNHD